MLEFLMLRIWAKISFLIVDIGLQSPFNRYSIMKKYDLGRGYDMHPEIESKKIEHGLEFCQIMSLDKLYRLKIGQILMDERWDTVLMTEILSLRIPWIECFNLNCHWINNSKKAEVEWFHWNPQAENLKFNFISCWKSITPLTFSKTRFLITKLKFQPLLFNPFKLASTRLATWITDINSLI